MLRKSNVDIEIEILPSPTSEDVTKHQMGVMLEEYYDLNPKMEAWINNSGHDITLTASEDLQLRKDDPHYIVLGQPSDPDFWDLPGPAVNVHLRNETGLPVFLTEESRNCTVLTNGKVKDLGKNNTITRLKKNE